MDVGKSSFALVLVLLGQYISCVWFYLGTMQDVYEGKGSDGVEAYSQGWIYALLSDNVGKENMTLTTKYITSIYWVYTTLSTLGYGDYYAGTTYEYLFTMAVQFMGVFLFAYMMGNINQLIEKLDDDHNEYIENEAELLDQWIMKVDRANPHRKLSNDLIKKIQESFKTYWKDDHTIVKKFDFINQLPVEIRHDVPSFVLCG